MRLLTTLLHHLTAPWRLVQHEVADIQARREFCAWVRDRGDLWGKGGEK